VSKVNDVKKIQKEGCKKKRNVKLWVPGPKKNLGGTKKTGWGYSFGSCIKRQLIDSNGTKRKSTCRSTERWVGGDTFNLGRGERRKQTKGAKPSRGVNNQREKKKVNNTTGERKGDIVLGKKNGGLIGGKLLKKNGEAG